jgi:hypothetical protein
MRCFAVLTLSLSCAGCVLPYEVVVPDGQHAFDEFIDVELDPALSLDTRGVSFVLRFFNRSDSPIALTSSKLLATEGARQGPVVIDREVAGHPDFVLIQPGQRGMVSFRATLVPEHSLRLEFRDAFTMKGQPLRVPPLDLIRPGTSLVNPNPAMLQAGVRLTGGALVGSSVSAPLVPERLMMGSLSGIVAGTLGVWTRLAELNLLARFGNGRLFEFEVGIRPGPPWLTLLVSYGMDWVRLDPNAKGGGKQLTGHGPRVTVDFGFDAVFDEMTGPHPKRWGLFVSGGPTWLSDDVEQTFLYAVIEMGVRLRLGR